MKGIKNKLIKTRELYTFYSRKKAKTREDERIQFMLLKRIYKLEQKIKQWEQELKEIRGLYNEY